MIDQNIHILLADDDSADCLLFKDALEELPVNASLKVVNNGEELMDEITKRGKKLPDVLFLDLNMPRKSGYSSLGEIKRSTNLQKIPVIVFSTACGIKTINNVYKDAAHYYICKPSDFSQLKKVIYQALTLINNKNNPLPGREQFIITGDSIVIPGSNQNATTGKG